MKTRRIVFQLIGFCVLGLCVALLFSCKPEEIIFHGDLTGTVSDATTSKPIQAADVRLSIQPYPKSTDSLGKYHFINLEPGNYELEVSKFQYDTIRSNVYVYEAEINTADFTLEGIPIINLSTKSLEYMMDRDELPIYISNIGLGTLRIHDITPSQNWISYDHKPDSITDQTDSIIVTINRSGLLIDSVYKESIEIVTNSGEPEIVHVHVNRSYYFTDERDGQQYKTVKIGNQWWMAKNLNIGRFMESNYTPWIRHSDVTNNGIIEKYCYDNNEAYCDTFGGLYDWDEMMDYGPSDTGVVGTTQGICPDGWHIPTDEEWISMINLLEGEEIAGGKLKEIGFTHWKPPNDGATNESGFTALPGGYRYCEGGFHEGMGVWGVFWTATRLSGGYPLPPYFWASSYLIEFSDTRIGYSNNPYTLNGYSVRCIRDE